MQVRRPLALRGVLPLVLLAALMAPVTPVRAAAVGERVEGGGPEAVAAALARWAHPVGPEVVYLASPASVTVAATVGSLRGGPLLLVPGCGAVPPVVLDEIARLDPERTVAVGGEAELCEATARAASGDRPMDRLEVPPDDGFPTPQRRYSSGSITLAAARFPLGATTLHIAGTQDREAAAAGWSLDGPTLLVESATTLAYEVRQAVARIDPDRVVALGGTDGVSDAVLEAVAGTRPTERLGTDGPPVLAASARRFGLGDGQTPATAVFLVPAEALPLRAAAAVLDQGPVLPVPAGCDALPEAALAGLQRLRSPRVVALGGTDGVCAAQLEQAVTASTVAPRLTATGRVLTAQERGALATVTANELQFAGPPPSLAGLAEGDVLVAEPAPAAPDGLLRRVTAVSTVDDRLVVATQEAGIAEVLAEGASATQAGLTAEPGSVAPGVSVRPLERAADGNEPEPVAGA